MARSSVWARALAFALVVSPLVAHAADTPVTDEQLATATDRGSLIRAALARNPGIKAAAQRVRAMRAMSSAESRLPDPEAMFDVWQVPFVKPYAFGESQMISVGVKQSFPAPGSLGARSESRQYAANAEEAMLADKGRDLVRDVQHAYVDLFEATTKHETHVSHVGVAKRVGDAAQMRLAGGGTLDDVAQAQLDLARLDADVATEAASIVRARARLNALLARPYDAPLGRPQIGEPVVVAMTPTALLDLAKRTRPELRAAEARIAAQQAEQRGFDREARWPSFSVGALYFAPTAIMPNHGYGVTATATLPWVWGGNEKKREASAALVQAGTLDAEDAKLRIGVEVGTASANAQAAAARLRSLRTGTLPAAKRAFEVTFAAYQSNKGDLLGLLRAERAVVDTEMEIVMARATLEHALADLDWAVGAILPRSPMDSQEAR